MIWPLVHLCTGAGREEVTKKGGGEEEGSVAAVCDECAAHGDRAAVGVDVDTQRNWTGENNPGTIPSKTY